MGKIEIELAIAMIEFTNNECRGFINEPFLSKDAKAEYEKQLKEGLAEIERYKAML
jgi:hypothetical protein